MMLALALRSLGFSMMILPYEWKCLPIAYAVEEDLQEGLSISVLDIGVHGVGDVLLADVDDGIDDSVGGLSGGEGEGGGGVEDGEDGEDEGVVEAELEALGSPGNDTSAVHLGTGLEMEGGKGAYGGEGEDDGEGNGLLHVLAIGLADLVSALGVSVIGGGGDELGAISDGTSTDGDEEGVVGTHLLDDGDGLHQSIVIGVGFNSAELSDLVSLEGLHDLVVDAVLLDGTASVGDEDLLVLRDVLGELGDLALTEDDTGGVDEIESVHRHSELGVGMTIKMKKRN